MEFVSRMEQSATGDPSKPIRKSHCQSDGVGICLKDSQRCITDSVYEDLLCSLLIIACKYQVLNNVLLSLKSEVHCLSIWCLSLNGIYSNDTGTYPLQVVIETSSFLDVADFTGLHLDYTVAPADLRYGDSSTVIKNINCVLCTTFDGASNSSQAGGLECVSWERLEVCH